MLDRFDWLRVFPFCCFYLPGLPDLRHWVSERLGPRSLNNARTAWEAPFGLPGSVVVFRTIVLEELGHELRNTHPSSLTNPSEAS